MMIITYHNAHYDDDHDDDLHCHIAWDCILSFYLGYWLGKWDMDYDIDQICLKEIWSFSPIIGL